jgi:hypothetical protein
MAAFAKKLAEGVKLATSCGKGLAGTSLTWRRDNLCFGF